MKEILLIINIMEAELIPGTMANIIVAKAVAYFLCNDAGSILLVRERSSAIT